MVCLNLAAEYLRSQHRPDDDHSHGG
jgi:hypothetical protein